MQASHQLVSRCADAAICHRDSKARAALAEGSWLVAEHAIEGKACSNVLSALQKLAEAAALPQDVV